MYTIGQVIYVLLSKNSQVYPMQVVEIITKKTLTGEDVRYVLQGGADRSNSIMLDQIDGETFESAEKARKVLLERATRHIDKLIRTAVKKSNEWYSDQQTSVEAGSIENLPDLAPRSSPGLQQSAYEEQSEQAELQQEVSLVTLPDGTVAKIKMPNIV